MKEIDQEEVSKRRGIYFPAFEIYGGVSGLYDYGPYGSRIVDNVVSIWKNLWLSEGNVAEYSGTALTHVQTLKSSGHYDRFFDYSTKCERCGTEFRVEDVLSSKEIEIKLEPKWLTRKISEMNLKCERCGGKLGNVREHKLMFPVDQGTEADPLYLRPETAQGIFINFKRYYRFFREKLPFAIIQVGRGYRNEVSPRRGIFRLREFNMMECEVFFDPLEEKWPSEIDDSSKILFLTNDDKEEVLTTKEAFDKGLIKSQPLSYFMGLSYKFFVKVGIDPKRFRFRQHKKEDLSHYSSDTWDAEALTQLGWIEIEGISHRGNFDLSNHIEFSTRDLYAQRVIPRKKIKLQKKEIDYRKVKEDFKTEMSSVISSIKNNQSIFRVDGGEVDLTHYYTIKEEESTTDRENFIPIVIEPSFGVDRILLALLDHNFAVREKTEYNYLKIPPEIAPYEAAVLPLMDKDNLGDRAREIFQNLLNKGLKVIYDDSGTIGKRYSRYDEVGVVYCLTIDYDTLEKGGVTIRHRDTREQIRIDERDIVKYISGNPWIGKGS